MIRKIILTCILLSIITACQPEGADIVLPTRVIVNEATIPPLLQGTAISTGPTLPPSQTPQPTRTPTLEVTAQPTPTREVDLGTIYYIYNGNSLIAVAGDGSGEEYLGPFDPPLPISDLVASPDGTLLAFVAPGSGSAQEVWVSNRNTTYVQSVTCLGLPYVRSLTWSPDSKTIAFLAGQSEDAPLNVYSASWIGSGDCPTGNNQRMLFDAQDKRISNLTYHSDGEILFYGDRSNGINGFNLNSESVTLSNLTRTSGFGPDFALTFNPQKSAFLGYIQSIQATASGKREGYLNVIDVINGDIVYSQQVPVETLQWSSDGELLLISERRRVYIYNLETGGTRDVISGLERHSPRAVFSPDSTLIAYIGAGQDDPQVQQIFVVDANGRNPRQITFNTVGAIDDFVWLSGHWNQG